MCTKPYKKRFHSNYNFKVKKGNSKTNYVKHIANINSLFSFSLSNKYYSVTYRVLLKILYYYLNDLYMLEIKDPLNWFKQYHKRVNP